MAWVSPTSFIDPDGVWEDEGNAYDEDERSYTYGDLDHYLELHRAAISCSKVRFHYLSDDNYDALNCDIDVHYGDAWSNIFSGLTGGVNEWEEFEIGSTQTVDAVRIRATSGVIACYFNEMDFWEVVGVTHELAGVIAGVASVSGSVINQKWLAGEIAGVASVSGAIARTLVLAGVSAGVASVSGAVALTLKLAGASAGAATAAATLTNQKWLASIVTGKAVVIGILTNQKWLAGVVAGKAVVSATLINIKWLAGVIAGVATASANLFHVRVAIRVLSAVRNLLALRNLPPVR